MSTSTAKRKKLATYSIRPNWWVRVRPWLIGLVITGIALGLIYWIWQPAATSQGTPSPEQTRIKDVIQILILILGFVFGYVQWIMARYEASLDRFYDRLDVANRRLGTMVEQAWNRANPVDMAGFDVYANPPRVGVGLFDMWVFAELDNLEYIIEKYKWGFITAAQACRALNTDPYPQGNRISDLGEELCEVSVLPAGPFDFDT
jgi:hypothetical protein